MCSTELFIEQELIRLKEKTVRDEQARRDVRVAFMMTSKTKKIVDNEKLF